MLRGYPFKWFRDVRGISPDRAVSAVAGNCDRVVTIKVRRQTPLLLPFPSEPRWSVHAHPEPISGKLAITLALTTFLAPSSLGITTDSEPCGIDRPLGTAQTVV